MKREGKLLWPDWPRPRPWRETRETQAAHKAVVEAEEAVERIQAQLDAAVEHLREVRAEEKAIREQQDADGPFIRLRYSGGEPRRYVVSRYSERSLWVRRPGDRKEIRLSINKDPGGGWWFSEHRTFGRKRFGGEEDFETTTEGEKVG